MRKTFETKNIAPASKLYLGRAKSQKGLLVLLFYCVSILTFTGLAQAGDLYQYKDDEGRVHYVDSASKVPEKYRASSSKVGGRISTAIKEPPSQPAEEPGFIDRLTNKLVQQTQQLNPQSQPAKKGKVEVLVAEWCPSCRALESELKNEKIPYTKYDVEKSIKGKQLYQQLGGGGVPLVRVNSKTLVHGNNVAKVKEALAK